MQLVQQSLRDVSVGRPHSFGGLTVFPVTNPNAPFEPDYLALAEALDGGTARVMEMPGHASVPELRFVNDGRKAVLLLDGEELLGARQNRVLNLSLMVPPRTSVTIPVSCVEAGRWHEHSPAFSGSSQVLYARARARKARHVTRSLRTSGAARSDQSALWDDIARKSSSMGSHSRSGAMAGVFECHDRDLESYVSEFGIERSQIGVVLAIDRRITALELFDCAGVVPKLLPKILRSYALDAIEQRDRRSAPSDAAQRLFDALSSAEELRFAVAGAGENVRLRGGGVSGGALVVGGRVVHVAAFLGEEA